MPSPFEGHRFSASISVFYWGVLVRPITTPAIVPAAALMARSLAQMGGSASPPRLRNRIRYHTTTSRRSAMRIIASVAVCLSVLYTVDAVFFGGTYLDLVSRFAADVRYR